MVDSRPLRQVFASVPNLFSAVKATMLKRRSRNVDHYSLSSSDDDNSDSHAAKRPPTSMTDILRYSEYTYDVDTPPTHTTGYFAVPNTPADLSCDSLSTHESLPPLIPVAVDTETDTISEEVVPDEEIFDDCDLRYIMQCLEAVNDINEGPIPRKCTAGDRPLLQWRVLVDSYLAELLRIEGRGVFTDGQCASCKMPLQGGYWREDCHDATLFCASCIVVAHGQNPLHRTQVWNGQYFENVSLKSLGLRIQLGHTVGHPCCRPVPAFNDDFVVLDINGIHEVGLSFCGCETVMPQYVQLLRNKLFPATSIDPKTAATFRLLQHYHLLSTQSKVSAYDFYMTLSKRTDNTGTKQPKDRYHSFLTMTKEWRHLKLLKRAGRGNDPAGAAGTAPGECAVDCPACPHPGKNLPSNWKNTPKGTRWLYKLFLGIDANFRLKRKKVSSDVADPGLNHGYAYFVNSSDYKTHLDAFDKSTTTLDDATKHCNTHDAIKLANIKGSASLASSGVATVDCSRHEMKRPCSIGDLQKGERHVNVDFLLDSTLKQNTPADVSASYDVACIYSVHIPQRFEKYAFDTLDTHSMEWSVPKFHINAHREYCRSAYSPYLLPEFGRYDGEGVERCWALTNPYASITKEMGPGSRRDMLDNAFGAQNWNKILTMARVAQTLLNRIKIAVPQRETHVLAFQEFTASFEDEVVTQWEADVQTWEADPKKAPNPYIVQRPHLSQAAIRLELAEKDKQALANGTATVLHEDFSASSMLVNGLEIEETQRRLHSEYKALTKHTPDLTRAKLIEKSNVLQRKIDTWRSVQQLFMPSVVTIQVQSGAVTPYQADLLLLSAACTRITIPPVLLEHEWELRRAQAYDALTDLRARLELRAHMYHYKDRFVRGQREGTRSNALLQSIESKKNTNVARYRAAFAALEVLSAALGKTHWRGNLRELRDGDVRHVSSDDGSGSEGRRELSWIWLAGEEDASTLQTEAGQQNIDASLRVEWCKARARAQRWSEECELLQEEMHRVLAYHEWRGSWWECQVGRNFADKLDYQEGADAYAFRQASIQRGIRARCQKAWRFVDAWICLGAGDEADGSSVVELPMVTAPPNV
ncbi:hypothetical protein C8Q80DRAFT_1316398 [Daedaleopsis nitida]|nr:hypothetical protein C8Q80DRAFT_1316398 [Daedaleopsis nitida]